MEYKDQLGKPVTLLIRFDRHLVRRITGIAFLSVLGTPVAAQTLIGDGSILCGQTYVVSSGDTLSILADRAYGDPMLYTVLVAANADQLAGNPDNLAIGMPVMVPCIDATGTVISGDVAEAMEGSLEDVVNVEGPLTEAEIDTLFGPVALFPDMVLSNVLVASTFPIEVVQAGRFVASSEGLTDEERADAAAAQTWDESVRQLAAAFPDLLTRMNEHIDWTEQAGEAVVAQTDDVLASIQRLRKQAQENGYLVGNDAQNVEVTGDTINIEPASPGVVYVPTYSTEVVYTTPISHPPHYHYGYHYDDDDWEDALIAGGIFLGGAIILDEIFDDDDWGDRWDGDVDIDWDGGDINIDRGDREFNFGDGDRISGERPGFGEGRGDLIQQGAGQRPGAGASNRPAIGDRPAVGNRPAPVNRVQPPNLANREAARSKIEARKSANQGVAKLPATRPSATRQPTRNQSISRPTATTRSAPIKRPSNARAPTTRRPSSSNAFRSSGGGRVRSTGGGRARSTGGGRSRGGGGGGRRR